MDFFDGYGLFGRKPPGADKENGMGELRWIKVATDLFENRKIRYLLRQPDGEKMVLMWIRLLCFAGRINDRGRVYFTEELPLDAATLADDAEGNPVYGIEVGEYAADGTFRKYARFTAEDLSFYDRSGSRVAWISDYQLHIISAEIAGNLRVGGYVLDTADGLAFRPLE